MNADVTHRLELESWGLPRAELGQSSVCVQLRSEVPSVQGPGVAVYDTYNGRSANEKWVTGARSESLVAVWAPFQDVSHEKAR